MTSNHRGTVHTGKDRDLDSYINITTKEDTEGIGMGSNNDNENTNSSDTILAFGGSEGVATSATSCPAARPI